MKHRARIVAGTALALVMATAYATASPQPEPRVPDGAGHALQAPMPDGTAAGAGVPVLLAQADDEEADEEELIRRRTEEAPAPAEEPPAAEPEPPAPAEEAPPPVEEPAAPEPEPAPEPPAPAEEAPAPVEEPAAAEPEPPAPAEEAPAPVEEPTAAEPEPAPEPPAEEAPAVPEEAPADAETPTAAEPLPGEEPPLPEDVPVPEQAPSPPSDGAEPLPGEAPAAPEEAPAPPPSDGAEPLPGDEPPAPEEAPAPPLQPSEDGEPLPGQAEDPREAPLLDSEKEDLGEAGEEATTDEPQPVEADPGPPPASDQEAQQLEEPVEIVPLAAEEGQRVERREERRERREGTNVLREIGDRIVIQLNNQVIVQSDDRDRIGYGAEEVYYEDLPRGRTRETVVRPNGVQVVTIYDRYGDVVRRSRIMPDGREHVLVYAEDRRREERRQWRDPGLDLPPLRLRIPRNEYILDAGRVQDPDIYYDFFRQPPVEPVRRLYTVDEVRYSARLRDSVRRVEMDTVTFDFGAASISEAEIPRLAAVADAMDRLLEDNPAETFLIEGHTDAVGSDEANLALSDRRAEAVAIALANVFDIPPENMVTQGYGERYLKIDTQEPERQNRRVVLRRITPLVAPVASAQ